MNKAGRIILCVFLVMGNAFRLIAQDVEILSYSYPDPEQSYVELHFLVDGSSLQWYPDTQNQVYRHQLCFFIEFVQGQKEKLEYAFQMDFESESPGGEDLYFHDIRRCPLQPGSYAFEVLVASRDHQGQLDTSAGVQIADSIEIAAQSPHAISEPILLRDLKRDSVSELAKNGLVVVPFSQNRLDPGTDVLVSYVEYYRQDLSESAVFIEHGILDLDSNEIIKTYKQLSSSARDIKILQIPIDGLPAGVYIYFVNVIDDTRVILSSAQQRFEKLQEATSEDVYLKMEDLFVGQLTDDEVSYAIRSLLPKIPQENLGLYHDLVENQKYKEMRVLLFGFWKGINPRDPEQAYRNYMEVIDEIDQEYGEGSIEGFETDRGYIYLKYGPPSDVFENQREISAPPYEIWVYHQFPATAQVGVKFLFYNPSLDGNQYLLLHSNALNERRNPQWQRVLYDLVPDEVEGVNYHDATDVSDGYLRLARDMFDDM